MKIITVIPLAKGIFKETLTYFMAADVPLGSVIAVPVRKKTIDALVIKSENLAASKSMIKSSAFSLKKADKVKGVSVLPGKVIRAAFKMRDYFGTNSPSVLSSVLPKIFLETYDKLKTRPESQIDKNNLKQEKLILQASLIERVSYYKTFIRESFAKKKSVFMTLPTVQNSEYFRQNLSKGIEDYVFTLSSNIGKKEFVAKYNSLLTDDHPALIIATPGYLFGVNECFSAVIVEHENAGAYRLISRPYLDMRIWAELLTAQYNIKLIFGDTMLRVETLWRVKNFELAEIMPTSYRLSASIKKEFIDMKKDPSPLPRQGSGQVGTGGAFTVLSEELKEKISDTIKSKKRIFLFAHRKGLSGITICNDCQTPLLCEYCDKPLALYENQMKQRFFMCHHCQHKKDAQVVCGTCQSWNLKALGIGCGRVQAEIASLYPEARVFRLDKERIKTAKEGQRMIEEFYKTPGAILLGTELALHYLKDPIENIAVVSFDSLFAIPDFKANEKIIRLLVELERYAKESLMIQTRQADQEVLAQFLSGNLSEFARQELKSREEFNYPPFFIPIKITYRGPKVNLEKAGAYLENLFKDYNPAIFRAFTPKIKNDYILNTVMKIKRTDWSLPEMTPDGRLDPVLLRKLQTLPPTLTVQINPDDLL